MLEFFHHYQRSIVVYLFIAVLSASMLLFGIDMFSPGDGQYAVKVNETEMSFRDIAERRRQYEDRLREQFGDAYEQFAAALNENLDGRIVDQMVEEELFVQTAEKQDLTVDSGAVQEMIAGIFGDAFSAQAYRSYLQQIGMTASQFESQVARDALRAEYQRLLAHFSETSEFEAIQQAQLAESTFTLGVASLTPEDVRAEVAEPTEEELLTYYEENALDYEKPARIQYNALPITPESVLSLVEVYDEDVEMYYVEHQSDFKTPARAKVAHIQINYGAESSPEALLAVKEKAQRVHERAVAGEDFASLVLETSDDLTTKGSAGSLGWLSEGTRDDAIEKAALGLQVEGIAELVETDYGFHIVKVEEFQEEGVKELEEVADEIKATLRKLEAPGYALVRAEELFDTWQQKEESLASLAADDELSVITGAKLLPAGEEIDRSLKGLTEKVLNTPADPRQLVELGPVSVLVEVVEYQEPVVPGFETVREQVLADVKEVRATALARERMEQVIAGTVNAETASLEESAAALQVPYREIEDVSRTKATEAPLSNPEIRSAVLRSRSPQLITQDAREVNGTFYAVTVTEVETPSAQELEKPLEEYQTSASYESFVSLRGTLIQSARVHSEIDIEPSLLVP